jgi:hypothetical protein
LLKEKNFHWPGQFSRRLFGRSIAGAGSLEPDVPETHRLRCPEFGAADFFVFDDIDFHDFVLLVVLLVVFLVLVVTSAAVVVLVVVVVIVAITHKNIVQNI